MADAINETVKYIYTNQNDPPTTYNLLFPGKEKKIDFTMFDKVKLS